MPRGPCLLLVFSGGLVTAHFAFAVYTLLGGPRSTLLTFPYLYLNTFNGFIFNWPSLTQPELLTRKPGNLQGCPEQSLLSEHPSLAPKRALLLSYPLVMGGTSTYLINKLENLRILLSFFYLLFCPMIWPWMETSDCISHTSFESI